MIIRVTINTEDCNEDAIEPHVMSINNEGVATMWYGSHNYFVPFKDVEIIECNHKCGTRRVREPTDDMFDTHDECYNCGKNMSEVIV